MDEAAKALSTAKKIGESQVAHSIAADQMQVVDEIFNPLRFIALHLKELNEIEKAKK